MIKTLKFKPININFLKLFNISQNAQNSYSSFFLIVIHFNLLKGWIILEDLFLYFLFLISFLIFAVEIFIFYLSHSFCQIPSFGIRALMEICGFMSDGPIGSKISTRNGPSPFHSILNDLPNKNALYGHIFVRHFPTKFILCIILDFPCLISLLIFPPSKMMQNGLKFPFPKIWWNVAKNCAHFHVKISIFWFIPRTFPSTPILYKNLLLFVK